GFSALQYSFSNVYNSSTSEFTAPSDGLYHFDVHITLVGPAGSFANLALWLNNSSIPRRSFMDLTGARQIMSISADLLLTAGDKLNVRLSTSTSGTTTITGGAYGWFSAHKIN
ncbi:MAG TPA: hypothetical protein VM187_08540, partial [Niastella sp.]|nr:hypothetical protein [Niastella sp.]